MSSSALSSSSTHNSPNPSSSGGPDLTPNNDHRMLAVAVVLGILSAVMLVVIVLITMRFKRRAGRRSSAGPFHGTAILERDHPAAQIIPFGAPSNAPRFNHTPGADMRIAYRRSDGAWDFEDNRKSFRPAGVNDLDATPSTASRSSTFFPKFQTEYLSSKERERRAEKARKYSQDDEYFDYDPITPPPPAYQPRQKEDA